MKLLDKIQKRSAKVGVIGLGYVGLPLVIQFVKAGFETVGFDTDADGKMCFTNTGCADEKDVFAFGKKPERGKFTNELFVDFRLIREIKFLESLDLRESSKLHFTIDRPLDLREHLLLKQAQEVILIAELCVSCILCFLKIDLTDAMQRKSFQIGIDVSGVHG